MLTRKTIGVRLYADELEALRTVAQREDRDPRRQAARIIREGLVALGALDHLNDPADEPEPQHAA
jgi:hypothetical protein